MIRNQYYVMKSSLASRYMIKSDELENLHDYNNSEYSILTFSSPGILECFHFIATQYPNERTSYTIEIEL